MNLSCESIINFLINENIKLHDVYLSYYKKTEKLGFRKLLLSMIDQEKDQEKELRQFKKQQNLNDPFPAQRLQDINLDDYKVTKEFSPEMSYRDFLILIIERKEKSIQLFEKLADKSMNNDIKFFFSKLADETSKIKAWVQDRYDLDILAQ